MNPQLTDLNNEKLISAQVIAEKLSLSRKAVYTMKRNGMICPCVNVGRGTIRWRQSDIELWILWDCCDEVTFKLRKDAEDDRP